MFTGAEHKFKGYKHIFKGGEHKFTEHEQKKKCKYSQEEPSGKGQSHHQ